MTTYTPRVAPASLERAYEDRPPWRVELFGGLRLVRGAAARTQFRTHRTGGVLGYLAYHRDRWHPRASLAGLFWPEDLPDRALCSVDTALRAIRLELEPPGTARGAALLENENSVCLSGRAVVTDVAEFKERIARAVRCPSRSRRLQLLLVAVEQYRPELMPDHRDEWLLPAQAELDELYVSAALTLTRDLSAAGQLQEGLTVAQRALEVDPFAGDLHRQVVRLHRRRGDEAAAARHQRAAQALLGASFDSAFARRAQGTPPEMRP